MKKFLTLLVVALLALNTFAELGYGVALTQNDFNNTSTVVKKEGTIEWDDNAVRCGGASNGISLGGPSWNWEDKYFDVKIANGVPNKLTFEYACNNVTSTDPDWYVKESSDGTNWSEAIWTTTSSSATWTSVSKDLQPDTRYVRLCFSGNFAGKFRNIKVTEKILMGTPNPQALEFGTVKVDEDTTMVFTLGWTNLEGTAVSSDEHFIVTPEAFGAIGAYLQTDTFTVRLATGTAGSYSGTITVEGRDKSATVEVSGSVEKYDQTISWSPAATINYGETLAAATASSGLAVTYEIADPSVIAIENGVLRAVYAGTTTVTAKQAGNYKYNAAANVSKTVTVTAPDTYGEFEQATCGDAVTFNGHVYTESFAGDVTVGTNYMGGDSIVHVAIAINAPTSGEDSLTIAVGTVRFWNGINLSGYAVGAHEVHATLTNAAGCDSLVTLALTVTKLETLHLATVQIGCEGDTVIIRDRVYTETTTDTIIAEGETRDTVYLDLVTIMPVYEFSESASAVIGEGYTWRDRTIETPETGVFHYEDAYQTLFGCDSVYRLTLTVTKAEVVNVPVELSFCHGGFAEYRDTVYTEAGTDVIYATGEVADTVYNVTVTELMPSVEAQEMTIRYGDEEAWNGVDLSEYLPGEYMLADTLTNAAGCDSVVTLALTVEKQDPYLINEDLGTCEGDTVEFRGIPYAEAGNDTLFIENALRDTVIYVTVAIYEKAYNELNDTVLAGYAVALPEGEWLLGEEVVSGEYMTLRSDTTGLEFFQYGETEHGCESVTKLTVVVTPNYEAIDHVSADGKAEKFFRNGVLYIRRGGNVYTATGERAE